MKENSLALIIISGLIISSCNNQPSKVAGSVEQNSISEDIHNGVESTTKVPYREAKHYFVKNSYTADHLIEIKIGTQEDFDKLFGMATTMGKDGKPTAINFEDQFVIAVIGEETSRNARITPSELEQVGEKIILSYVVSRGEPQSSTIRPLLLLIVDKKYDGELEGREQ